jgi:hypothetical protein
MKTRFADAGNVISAIAILFIATLASPALALSRYECKGLASETIVLTPFQDGSVNLSFDKGPVEATAKFSHHGDVFSAEFDNVNGVQDAMLIFIFDTITKNGYEYFRLPSKGSGAAKITCWWFQN